MIPSLQPKRPRASQTSSDLQQKTVDSSAVLGSHGNNYQQSRQLVASMAERCGVLKSERPFSKADSSNPGN
jgi:hypothetical protein